ncbi:hypothetical protein ACQPZX_41500 [Actinoplanes sp. CA-142083]|uniref:hypothetical protein n=1 Tax=Actinoplanes sp. CA-142083 TaxID=3239903 RepID=UPI003D8BA355
MTQPQDANDILMGSGAPGLKFETVGTSYTGTVAAEPTASQQTDFRTKVPETWPDGSPKMQVLVQVSTSLRDPQKPEDDGTRTLYIKGKELTNAIRAAVRASGANGIHTGGILTVAYVGDGQAQPGMNAPKLYAAQYQAPAVSFAGVTAPTAPAQNAPIQSQQPITAATIAAPIAAQPCPPGVEPAMWVRLTPAQQQAVASAQAAQAQPQPAF